MISAIEHVRKQIKWYSMPTLQELTFDWGNKYSVIFLNIGKTYSWGEDVSKHRKCNLSWSDAALMLTRPIL